MGALRKARRLAFDLVAPRWLNLRNLVSRKPVTGDVPVAVSLTTHGNRFEYVHLAIESIARGRRRPERFILWLDDDELLANPTPQVRRLQSRGLEVRRARNYLPHTKYFPYVASLKEHSMPLVTADDDIFYPASWLERLYEAHRRRPDLVLCYRAREIQFDSGGLAPYATWPITSSTAPSKRLMALGVSGVLYPASMLNALRDRGDAFMGVTPGADDIWLHAVAVTSGHLVQQIDAAGRHFPLFAHAPDEALAISNQVGGRNDIYIDAVYGETELSAIRAGAI